MASVKQIIARRTNIKRAVLAKKVNKAYLKIKRDLKKLGLVYK